ncbi:serine/threonine protein kinase [Streptomyces sp. NPDC054794]
MAMDKAHASGHESAAGRYRLLEVVHQETNRVCWYAESLESAGDAAYGDNAAGAARRPLLVTQIALPYGTAEETAHLTTARILRTSELMGVLRPGRVATVIDAIEEIGTLWTVAEWIDAIPLGELLTREGAFTCARAARIGLELLDVLEAAHGEGFTHGELSPGQLFVSDRGPVVVTGFGLAGATLAPRVTAPSYASPEQARDERIGPAADMWALGAILYTMIEGRPPFRDRGGHEPTLKGVDRLPLRPPLRAGPLTQTVLGLLRKDSRERPTRPVVREALTRVLGEHPEEGPLPAPSPRPRGTRLMPPGRSRRTMLAGTALAVATVSAAVLAGTRGLPGADSTGTAAEAPRPSATAASGDARPDGHATRPSPAPSRTAAPARPGTGSPSARPSASPSATPSASKSAPANALPAGFGRYTAPEGFSVALPAGWQRLETKRAGNQAFRVTFGPGGDDPRTLAVTYSARVGPDPVAVWRDEVQPGLRKLLGFRLIGAIKATSYRGHKAADMEWLEGSAKNGTRTFGRGFLIGGHRSFSLRFTAPAASFDGTADRLALKTFLQTFREPAN